MIEPLKQLYAKHLTTSLSHIDDPDQYVWFQTDDGPIGISKSALTDKERALLEMFLTPYLSNQALNDKQSFWYDLLYNGVISADFAEEEASSFRLIHFFVKDPAIDVDSFAEAVEGLFPSEMTILWETEQEGILIEPTDVLAETEIEYKDLADAVTSDFYTDLYLYVGRKQNRYEAAHMQNRKEKAFFRLCRKKYASEKNVFYHDEQIPFLLLQQVHDSAKDDLLKDLFAEVADDRELLLSIHEYLNCNMNVTTAAKKLYIHRNSLQYRVDKFIEKTGLDVRSFPEAVTVYLALLDQFLPRS